MPASKKIVIKERKLGRENALGQSYKDEGLIEIDPRQNSFDYLDTVIHETLHVLFPELTEKQVISKSKKMAKVLWKLHYRRVHN